MKQKQHKRLLLVITLNLLSSIVFAHAVVTKSTFDEKSITANQPTTVSLFFNSLIKVPLSRTDLVNKTNKRTELTVISGKQLGEVRIELPALEQGEYALNYKMSALDGHMTEGTINFTVK